MCIVDLVPRVNRCNAGFEVADEVNGAGILARFHVEEDVDLDKAGCQWRVHWIAAWVVLGLKDGVVLVQWRMFAEGNSDDVLERAKTKERVLTLQYCREK